MQPNQAVQDALIDYLQHAYALEGQLVAVLELPALAANANPTVQHQIQNLLAETRQHRARMESFLAIDEQQPPANTMRLNPGYNQSAIPPSAIVEGLTDAGAPPA